MALTDWPLHVLNARNGRIGYIDEVMGGPVEILLRVGAGIRAAWRPCARAQVLQDLSQGPSDQQIRLGQTAAENVLEVVSENTAEHGMSSDAAHRARIPPIPAEGPRPLWSVMIPTFNCSR